ncbi:MAG: CvpA family protein [Oscillospiraceae bacterium]
MYGIIIMVILIFLVKILAKFLNGVFSFSIVGKLNRILGGIAGIPKGIIIAMLFCMIISLIVSLTPDGFLIFKTEAMEKSWFFSHFSFNLPV